MKYLIYLSLILLSACTARTINGKEQTFTDYVILNKYSDYKGKSVDDWKKQPSENFIGIRLINWCNNKEIENE